MLLRTCMQLACSAMQDIHVASCTLWLLLSTLHVMQDSLCLHQHGVQHALIVSRGAAWGLAHDHGPP